jgi:hypothetical protein
MLFLKEELECFRNQLLRKDSHVNSLEMSLTQKNEEMDLMEEKITQIIQESKLNIKKLEDDNFADKESIKNQCQIWQKELLDKELKIELLSTEINSLKKLIDEFEEQKFVLLAKLEKQETQFAELEKLFNVVSNEQKKTGISKNNLSELIIVDNSELMRSEKSFQSTHEYIEKTSQTDSFINEFCNAKDDEIKQKEECIKLLNKRIEELERTFEEKCSLEKRLSNTNNEATKKIEHQVMVYFCCFYIFKEGNFHLTLRPHN